MKKSGYILASFLCLLAGSAIYLVYAPSVLFIRGSFSSHAISAMQEKLVFIKTVFPNTPFIKYHLPDILWYQSLLLLIIDFYHIRKIFHAGFLYYCTLSLPFLLELLQLLQVIPGTFDWLDIFFYAILLFLNYLYIFWKENDQT